MRHFLNKLRSMAHYTLQSDRAFMPLEILLILTDQCNYKCRVCSLWQGIYQDSNKEPLALSEIKELINQCAVLGVPTFLISGGEPLLHPNFLEIIRYTSQRIPIVRLNTNASLITQEIADELVDMGLQEIWVSLDGPHEYYNRFRGVPNAYQRTVAGLEYIIEAKRKKSLPNPRVLVDTIVTPENRDLLPEFIAVLGALGVEDLNLVHTCYVPPEAVGKTEKLLALTNIYSGQFTTSTGASAVGVRLGKEQVRAIKKAADRIGLYIDPLLTAPANQNRPPCRCLFPWMNLMLFPHGEACVCPLLDFVSIGNVRHQPIQEIWNCELMREIRRKITKGFPVCDHCICTRRTPMDHLKHRQTLSRIF